MRDSRAIVFLLVASCAAAPEPDFEGVRARVSAATGVAEVHDPERGPPAAADLDATLRDGLTRAEALRLAMTCNPRLAAGFQALGAAEAERVQAGLGSNPELSFALLFPQGGGGPKLAVDLLASVADLWRLPARRAEAQAEYEAQLLALVHGAARLAHETALAFHGLQRAREELELRDEELALAREELALVRQGVTQGVASAQAGERAALALHEAELARSEAEGELARARAELAQALGLERALDCALVDAPLPAGEEEGELEQQVALALAMRLDLRASAAAVSVAERALGRARGEARPAASAGAGYERETDGTDLLGVAGTLELPLFDPGTARVTRARFRLEELRERHRALVVEASQEVRLAFERRRQARSALRIARDELQPRAAELERRLERAVAAGDATRQESLAARRASVAARRAASEALHAARLAELELTLALGQPPRP